MSGEERLSQALTLARRELGMGAALFSEIVGGHEIVRAIVGSEEVPGIEPGMDVPLDETICRRMLSGEIDGVVGDLRARPGLRELPLVRTAGIGAYIGVPITGPDARTYVLCCLALEERPDLGACEHRFLEGLAETIRLSLETER